MKFAGTFVAAQGMCLCPDCDVRRAFDKFFIEACKRATQAGLIKLIKQLGRPRLEPHGFCRAGDCRYNNQTIARLREAVAAMDAAKPSGSL